MAAFWSAKRTEHLRHLVQQGLSLDELCADKHLGASAPMLRNKLTRL